MKTPTKYEYDSVPLGGFESTSEQPYRLSITTQETYQHLTETTKHQQQIDNNKLYHHTSPIIASNQHPIYDDSYQNEINTITNYKFEPVTQKNYGASAPSLPPIPSKLHPSEQTLEDTLSNLNTTSLQLLLTKMQEENYLPKTFSVNNLDNSMKTLAKVLIDLKKTQKLPKPQYVANEEQYDGVKSTYTANANTGTSIRRKVYVFIRVLRSF